MRLQRKKGKDVRKASGLASAFNKSDMIIRRVNIESDIIKRNKAQEERAYDTHPTDYCTPANHGNATRP